MAKGRTPRVPSAAKVEGAAGALAPGRYVQMTLMIPVSGDVFKDAPILVNADKAITDFRAALDTVGLPAGWSLTTDQVTVRGPKAATTAAASPAETPPVEPPPTQAAEPNPAEPALPMGGEAGAAPPPPAWSPGAGAAAAAAAPPVAAK